MALRTRIAVTFLLLLTAVLAAALGAVSVTNHGNAEREVQRQLAVGASVFSRLLESNRRQLTQAAQAVASDYGFREAVSQRDTETLVELIRSRENFQALHVPYLGSTKALIDLTEGRFDFMFLDATVALSQIAAGKLKALAVTGSTRDPTLPDVPTLTEFVPGLDLRPWMSVVAPAGTPAPILQRLNSEINKALADRDFVQRLREAGVEPLPLTVAAFDDFIRNDSGRWAELVKISGAKAE